MSMSGWTARAFAMAAGSKARTRAPSFCRSSTTASAGDSRMSSVSGLKERPRTAAVLPASGPAAARIFSIMRRFVFSLTRIVASMISKW